VVIRAVPPGRFIDLEGQSLPFWARSEVIEATGEDDYNLGPFQYVARGPNILPLRDAPTLEIPD